MVQVIITDQNKFESLTKVFKKKVQKEGLIKESRRRAEYEKPSERIKRKRKESIMRNRRRRGK
jgi:small subunit ribosomal protein S21